MRRLSLPSLLCIPLALSACAGDASDVAADGDDSGGTSSGDTSGGDASGPGTSGGDDSADSTGEAPKFEPIPARGITLTYIEANQGVEVPVYANGAWVDGAGRNAELIKERMTFFRAFWQLAPDFEPRDIEARITLSYPDGTSETAAKVVYVEGESIDTDLDQSIHFFVPPELIRPQVQFQFELFETDLGYEDTPEPEQTAWPVEPGYVGVESADMTLRVVVVPVHHDLGPECPEAPIVDDQALSVFRDQLFMQNPVQNVDIVVRDPITYTGSLGSFGGLLSTLAGLHDTDGGDPSAYYYGVVRPCDGGPDGVGGQAIDIPGFPSQGNYYSRTAVGRWYSNVSQTAGTFVHEIGHTQGRRHIACSGSEGGTDPSYPYEGGTIGVWGFGTEDFSLHKPTTAKDYMTYCGNTWVSDWGWHKVFPYIREITSWDTQDTGVDPSQRRPLLVGLIEPETGTEHWFTTRGTTTGRAPAVDALEIAVDGKVFELPATLGAMGEAGAYNVVVELPETMDLLAADQITHVQGGNRYDIDEVRVGAQTLVLTK